ncbi:MAG: hypothetical protein M3011_01875 [Actinomycetota bacterium]|nr:hypothetical protein [Actinomycetota bacterium]
MNKRDGIVLRVAAGWTVFVWGTFIRNIVKDTTHTTGFKVVHITLAVVSLGFAAAIWMIASRNRKQSADRVDAP